MRSEFVYKGWLGWCPIYISANLNRPTIKARRFIPNFWLDINAIGLNVGKQDKSRIRITGRIN